ncbi:hypothetical protein CDIK_3445 [Cucumispora dikerogammari]|nr:hypothetical protein CDIK_3445 [Cucumispora dikerogammari]
MKYNYTKNEDLSILQKTSTEIYNSNKETIPSIINKLLTKYKTFQQTLKELKTKKSQLINNFEQIKSSVENTELYINETALTIQNDERELQKRSAIITNKLMEITNLQNKKLDLKYRLDVLSHKHLTMLNSNIKINEKYEKMKFLMEKITGVEFVKIDRGIEIVFIKNGQKGTLSICCVPDLKIIKSEPVISLIELNELFKNEDLFGVFLKRARELFFD